MNNETKPAYQSPEDFFKSPLLPAHRKYEVLRAIYVEGLSAAEAASRMGYTVMAVYSLVRDFKLAIGDGRAEQFFFASARAGALPGRTRGSARSK